MSNVVLMVGLAGSGKSTYVANVLKDFDDSNYVVISTDYLRSVYGKSEDDQSVSRQVFNEACRILETHLVFCTSLIIIDAMNLTRKSRKRFLSIARRHGAETYAYCMRTPVQECIRRNEKRDRKVPIEVIRSQATRYSPPSEESGEVDHVYFIEPTQVSQL